MMLNQRARSQRLLAPRGSASRRPAPRAASARHRQSGAATAAPRKEPPRGLGAERGGFVPVARPARLAAARLLGCRPSPFPAAPALSPCPVFLATKAAFSSPPAAFTALQQPRRGTAGSRPVLPPVLTPWPRPPRLHPAAASARPGRSAPPAPSCCASAAAATAPPVTCCPARRRGQWRGALRECARPPSPPAPPPRGTAAPPPRPPPNRRQQGRGAGRPADGAASADPRQGHLPAAGPAPPQRCATPRLLAPRRGAGRAHPALGCRCAARRRQPAERQALRRPTAGPSPGTGHRMARSAASSHGTLSSRSSVASRSYRSRSQRTGTRLVQRERKRERCSLERHRTHSF